MEINEAIDILREYVALDRETRETEGCSSDFNKFCEEKCVAIETVVDFIFKEK